MEKRKVGATSLEVAPLMLGGNVFGWTVDEPTSFSLLDAFTDAGLNFIDTADAYSSWVPGNKGGESETIIGKWLKKSGKRGKIVLATKVGLPMGEGKKGLLRAYITTAVEDSLRRLQTDCIDLYQSHRPDPATPIEETLAAYDGLIKAGKVRTIGASNYTPAQLEEALLASRTHALPAYQCLQPQYNLYDRAEYELGAEPFCREHGLGVICYYSLASGFLTGKYRTANDIGKAARAERVRGYLDNRGLKILAALDAVAARTGSTPARVALAWLIARPGITAPIASATSLKQLEDLVAAVSLKLNERDIALLTEASDYRQGLAA